MEVIQDSNQELVFLYQLVEGNTNSSYACRIATMAGLPEDIVKRGAEVTDLLRKNQPIGRIDTVDAETQYKCCNAIIENFMGIDFDKDDVHTFLQTVLQASKQYHF